MPELPEVETIKLGLQKYLVGHTITHIDVRLPKVVSGNVAAVTGAKVKDIRRFGKGLVIDLDNNHSIAIHIKMTGQLIYVGPNTPKGSNPSPEKVGTLPGSATHVIFTLDNYGVLYYNDFRRFGWIKIVLTNEIPELPFFKDLGPEPFKDLDLPLFKKIISTGKGPIKPLLMDQKKIGGIGNIYANDSLYRAGIDPKRKAPTLTEKEIEALFHAIEEVMQKGLEAGGSSEWSYVNSLGETGNYQKIFLVYGRAGTKCKRCGDAIQKIQFSGRGTYFCPSCQK